MLIDANLTRLYLDHPEAWEMGYDELSRRFWAYSPLAVAKARYIATGIKAARDAAALAHRVADAFASVKASI